MYDVTTVSLALQAPQSLAYGSSNAELVSPSFTESAAQSTEAAKKGAGELFTSLRATYNSVAQTISELDFSPLSKQATFVKYAAFCLFVLSPSPVC